jgi:hypothetical protein
MPCTVSIKGKGTKSPTSHGESEVTASAMPAASSIASSLLEGLSFQFPVIKGLRENSSLGSLYEPVRCEVKAAALLKRPEAKIKETNFIMVDVMRQIQEQKPETRIIECVFMFLCRQRHAFVSMTSRMDDIIPKSV